MVMALGTREVLDGFLLVLTADGTILYVSDNVLQYLGYNQVDLMHRCLYSVVHHDDMVDLKMVLETSLGHLVTHFDHQGNQESGHHVEECSLGVGEACKPLSFICRMRCFSGSSVGYLKMHCSGKIVHETSLPKSKRSSSNVVLLFCNPFMLRAAEFTTDLQKNVFWTKHDLDLVIKEVDKKGADIIGFHTEELEKQSFYSLIHPEDLTALATCHKLLVESSEVQTVYFRLQTKGGDWVWLTSRGKVISKNSKKFSIAFSHCPLREEDSTYIQQEAVLRRRYAISDLMCLAQFKHTIPPPMGHTMSTEDKHLPPKSKKLDSHRYHPYSSDGPHGSSTAKSGKSDDKKEEAGLLDTSCIMEVACPSAWHAMADRHSPVLPSNHVAHKISQREKQLQFQEFCRRQQLEGDSHGNQVKFSSTWDDRQPYPVSPGDDAMTSCADGQEMMLPASSRLPISGPSAACFYSNDAGLGSFGSCVDYGFGPPQAQAGNAAAYIQHWYNGGSPSVADMMMNQSSAACLTPTRSPHQCGVVPLMQAAVSNPCSFQPSLAPCDAVVNAATQNVGGGGGAVVANSSMPPSPPPSPPTLCHRPAPPYHHNVDVVGAGENIHAPSIHHYYRPQWFEPMQSYFGYPAQQPPPYPRSNAGGALAGGPAMVSASTSTSTLNDLEKTTQKFLPVKTETESEENKGLPVNPQQEGQEAAQPNGRGSSATAGCSRSDSWGRPAAWTSNGHADRTPRPPGTVSLSHLGQAPAGNRLEHSGPKGRPDLPAAAYLPPGYQEAQMIQQPPTFFCPPGAQAAAQYLPYPFPTAHTALGSPPAYPYGIQYPQLGHQSGQYPVSGFYATQGAPVKAVADFARPITERPADLPSIGSFLEYLNEV